MSTILPAIKLNCSRCLQVSLLCVKQLSLSAFFLYGTAGELPLQLPWQQKIPHTLELTIETWQSPQAPVFSLWPRKSRRLRLNVSLLSSSKSFKWICDLKTQTKCRKNKGLENVNGINMQTCSSLYCLVLDIINHSR